MMHAACRARGCLEDVVIHELLPSVESTKRHEDVAVLVSDLIGNQQTEHLTIPLAHDLGLWRCHDYMAKPQDVRWTRRRSAKISGPAVGIGARVHRGALKDDRVNRHNSPNQFYAVAVGVLNNGLPSATGFLALSYRHAGRRRHAIEILSRA